MYGFSTYSNQLVFSYKLQIYGQKFIDSSVTFVKTKKSTKMLDSVCSDYTTRHNGLKERGLWFELLFEKTLNTRAAGECCCRGEVQRWSDSCFLHFSQCNTYIYIIYVITMQNLKFNNTQLLKTNVALNYLNSFHI